MVGWRHFTTAIVYNSVCYLEKALEWMKMSSTTGNKTCPTLFKAMTQGIFGTWTKLDLPDIIQGYDIRDIWNVDETGLL